MIEEGKFPRRKTRAAKRLTGQKREDYLRENPVGDYRYRICTGVKKNGLGMPSPQINAILSERLSWCRQQVGDDNTLWNHRFEKGNGQDRELVFLFQNQAQATAFLLRFGGLDQGVH
jgi:hypothetical protein